MDLFSMVEFAKKKGADLTIAALCVKEKEATRMGLLKINDESFITDFYEKPSDRKTLDFYRLPTQFLKGKNIQEIEESYYLGSMGIYIFKREALFSLLENNPKEDFGKHLIPEQIKKSRATAFYYDGYWEDIGTIGSYYDASLSLTKNKLGLDLYNEALPIFSHPLHLPCARICHTHVQDSIISQGSIIEASEINNSMVGLRSIIKKGTKIYNSVLIGNQYYTPPSSLKETLPEEFSIGEDCLIKNAIIDEHVRIGNHVKLINKDQLRQYDGKGIYIRDGIIVVSAGMTLPDHFTL
jgi:glucose-1-phosphate adenylyltransferase